MRLDSEWVLIDPFFTEIHAANIRLVFRSKKLRSHDDEKRLSVVSQPADFDHKCQGRPFAGRSLVDTEMKNVL